MKVERNCSCKVCKSRLELQTPSMSVISLYLQSVLISRCDCHSLGSHDLIEGEGMSSGFLWNSCRFGKQCTELRKKELRESAGGGNQCVRQSRVRGGQRLSWACLDAPDKVPGTQQEETRDWLLGDWNTDK